MTPSRMPDYRLPNKRGIVGQAGAVLHRRPATAGALLAALLILVAGTTAAAADSDFPSAAAIACPAARELPTGETSALLQMAAGSLAGMIVHLRDTALQQGTLPVPDEIRAQLNGFVPEEILDLVRWRSDDADGLTRSGILSAISLVAVTVDYVVLFTDPDIARTNPGIWAHEIRHVMQYRECGVDGFALAYLTGHDRLETDARHYSLAWHQWTLDRWLERVTGRGAE